MLKRLTFICCFIFWIILMFLSIILFPITVIYYIFTGISIPSECAIKIISLDD